MGKTTRRERKVVGREKDDVLAVALWVKKGTRGAIHKALSVLKSERRYNLLYVGGLSGDKTSPSTF